MAAQNITLHREELHTYKEYLGSPLFTGTFGWRSSGGNGHVLAPVTSVNAEGKQSNLEASLIIIGEVMPSRMWIEGLGGWNPKWGNPMSAAKFSLTLEEPSHSLYAEDWKNSVGRLNSAIALLSGSGKIQNPISAKGSQVFIKFGVPVFEPWDNTKPLDPVMQRWTVDEEYQESFNKLKTRYQIKALPVFDMNDNFIEPDRIKAPLKGALVKMHFSLKHWRIQRNNQPAQDTFSLIMKQICILKNVRPPAPNPYKTTNGPYRPGAGSPGYSHQSFSPSPLQTSTVLHGSQLQLVTPPHMPNYGGLQSPFAPMSSPTKGPNGQGKAVTKSSSDIFLLPGHMPFPLSQRHLPFLTSAPVSPALGTPQMSPQSPPSAELAAMFEQWKQSFLQSLPSNGYTTPTYGSPSYDSPAYGSLGSLVPIPQMAQGGFPNGAGNHMMGGSSTQYSEGRVLVPATPPDYGTDDVPSVTQPKLLPPRPVRPTSSVSARFTGDAAVAPVAAPSVTELPVGNAGSKETQGTAPELQLHLEAGSGLKKRKATDEIEGQPVQKVACNK
ncbi:uncharacterized protein ARMOST_06529 [Armillaria ostoyae]|uniref:Uncharacterized protein n=1 Tax=Armillaria ostoyae TaxID=47428 RepID=A0A284R387_ARMOS|nr:uncharacterized protein ARMOST_06529 [Armillaria ostoyae]